MTLRRLDAWVAASLLTQDQATAIRAWEKQHRHPWGWWAVFGLGGLALGLGLIALIASNWQAIPDTAKLAVHFLLVIASGGFMIRAAMSAKPLWIELALFLFAILVLGGLILIGQVFHTSSALWQLIAFWLVLLTPLFWICGQGKLSGLLWAAGAVSLVGGLVEEFDSWLDAHRWALGFPLLTPVLLVACGCLGDMISGKKRSDFWKTLAFMGLSLALLGACLSVEIDWPSQSGMGAFGYSLKPALPLLFIGTALIMGGLWRSRMISLSTVMPLMAATIAFSLPTLVPLSGIPGQVMGALAFIALWSVVAWSALRIKNIGFFRVAILLIALRVIAAYFEVFGSLARTGIGLMISGAILLGGAVFMLRYWQRTRTGPAL